MRLLLLEGHAGVGKSSLIAAACGRARAADMRVLSARCSSLEQDFAWGAAIELIGTALSQSSADERARLLGGTGAPMFRLFDHRLAPERTPSPQTVAAVVHGLFWLIADLAQRAPVALLLDDAQWCDASSLRLLVYLLERLEQLPVAIVLAVRPRHQGQQPDLLERIATHDGARTVRVQALGPKSELWPPPRYVE